MKKNGFKVIKDITDSINNIIKLLKDDQVLVGIPQDTSERKEDEGESPINNATILAINEFGSPSNNIPPRPVMAIGIRNAQDQIANQMKVAAKSLLEADSGKATQAYERMGLIASNSVKKAINAQEGFEGPSEATLAARERAGFKGTKSLIVTGQLRNSITYVVNTGAKAFKKRAS